MDFHHSSTRHILAFGTSFINDNIYLSSSVDIIIQKRLNFAKHLCPRPHGDPLILYIRQKYLIMLSIAIWSLTVGD